MRNSTKIKLLLEEHELTLSKNEDKIAMIITKLSDQTSCVFFDMNMSKLLDRAIKISKPKKIDYLNK